MPRVEKSERSREDRIISEIRPVSVVEDIPPSEVPPDFWTDTTNFYMRRSYAQRVGGLSQFFADWTDGPLNMTNVAEVTTNFWVVMGQNTIQVVDQSGAVSDVTPAVYVGPVLSADANQTIINGFPVQNFRPRKQGLRSSRREL